jgi:hypothetical protein
MSWLRYMIVLPDPVVQEDRSQQVELARVVFRQARRLSTGTHSAADEDVPPGAFCAIARGSSSEALTSLPDHQDV